MRFARKLYQRRWPYYVSSSRFVEPVAQKSTPYWFVQMGSFARSLSRAGTRSQASPLRQLYKVRKPVDAF